MDERLGKSLVLALYLRRIIVEFDENWKFLANALIYFPARADRHIAARVPQALSGRGELERDSAAFSLGSDHFDFAIRSASDFSTLAWRDAYFDARSEDLSSISVLMMNPTRFRDFA